MTYTPDEIRAEISRVAWLNIPLALGNLPAMALWLLEEYEKARSLCIDSIKQQQEMLYALGKWDDYSPVSEEWLDTNFKRNIDTWDLGSTLLGNRVFVSRWCVDNSFIVVISDFGKVLRKPTKGQIRHLCTAFNFSLEEKDA